MRTGLGGTKVVLGGGAFVLPIVHDVIPVNMNTLRLEVARSRAATLEPPVECALRIDDEGERSHGESWSVSVADTGVELLLP